MKEKFVWALDISMSCTGITIFQNDAKPIYIGSIKTDGKDSHQKRLKVFGNKIIELLNLYEPEIVVFERGFYRFSNSTEVIFRVFGVAQYLLSDYEQEFYPPTTIKKLVGGIGSMKKDELAKIILNKYCDKNVMFLDNNQSDSYAIGICYFIKNGVLK